MKLIPLLKIIKNDYLTKYGSITYEKGEFRSCVELWIDKLNNSEYQIIFSNLLTNQWKNYVLIRYDNYINLFGDGETSYTDFWDMYDGLYRECRSVVVDVHTMSYVIRPFDKFFNMDERDETSYGVIAQKFLRTDYITVTNKLDGSMQCGRYYNGEFIMSGAQSIDPSQSWRLEDGYSMLTENYRNMLQDYDEYTFIFEYISKKDAHVVVYDDSQCGLHLIGARHYLTGDYMSYHELKIIATNRGIPLTESYEMDLGQIMKTLGQYKSNEKEGYVVRFTDDCGDFFVKIKCDDYVAIHGILSSLQSPNIIIKQIGNGTFDDFISKIPEGHKERVMKIANDVFTYNDNMKYQVSCWCQTLDSYKFPELKDKMIYITNYVPKEYQGYVREYVKTGEICKNYIKKRTGGYLKYLDILYEIKNMY